MDEIKKLQDEMARLSEEIRKLKEIDLDSILTPSKKTVSEESVPKKPRHEKPDWVKAWNRERARSGKTKIAVKTTKTYSKEAGFGHRTEMLEPFVKTEFRRDPETGKIEERIVDVGLPDHLQLGVLHSDRVVPIEWKERPTDDAVAPHGLSDRESREWLAANPGKPLELRDEGPTKPVGKQMNKLNRFWKYRNFRACDHCGEYDTWEARTDPHDVENVGVVHAYVWCHKCGAIDAEASDRMPENIGSWAPPKQTTKEIAMKEKRKAYREAATLEALAKTPMTTWELLKWFREVQKYSAVDVVMLDVMLNRMKREGRVRTSEGKWTIPTPPQKKK